MRKFVYSIAILMLVACTSECDKNGFSLGTGSCTVSSQDNNNGGSSRQQTTNTNTGGTTITYERHDAPGLPSQLYVQAQYHGEVGLIHVASNDSHPGMLLFTASIVGAKFEPELKNGAFQINLAQAESFSVLSPDTTGCPLTSKEWGTAGATTSVIQFTLGDSDACQNLLVQMKTLGFQVQFTNVPANYGGKIANVTYVVRP